MKKINTSLLVIALCFAVSACKYSNQFNGTLNGESANLSIKTRNIHQQCVDALVKTGATQKIYSVNASIAFDAQNVGAAKTFSTKNTTCNEGAAEYIVGARTPKVLATNKIMAVESEDNFYCQTVAYREYTYVEELSFEVKDLVSDQLVSSFKGVGKKFQYIDYSNPELIGDRWVCGWPYAFDE